MYSLARVVLVSALLCLAFADDHAVKHLTGDNFHDVVDGSVPAFVKFYAPWCGHCKKLAPDYETLYNAFLKTEVEVVKVDCTEESELCKEFGVTGYPTLKFFPKGSTEPEAYSGGRTVDDIASFITTKTGIKAKISKPQSLVVTLTDSTFDEIVLDESKFVLSEFYAPWCGHCKNLAPVYESLARVFQSDEEVVIAKIDADSQKEKAGVYGVSGFPTLKFFPKNNEVEDYSGGRDLESLVSFINEKAGTFRLSSGRLNELAGRVESLDEIASKFVKQSTDEKKASINAVKDLITSESVDTWTGKVYTRAFTKIAEDVSYIEKETARLSNMVESGSINDKKIDEFTKRINILKVFETESE